MLNARARATIISKGSVKYSKQSNRKIITPNIYYLMTDDKRYQIDR